MREKSRRDHIFIYNRASTLPEYKEGFLDWATWFLTRVASNRSPGKSEIFQLLNREYSFAAERTTFELFNTNNSVISGRKLQQMTFSKTILKIDH